MQKLPRRMGQMTNEFRKACFYLHYNTNRYYIATEYEKLS